MITKVILKLSVDNVKEVIEEIYEEESQEVYIAGQEIFDNPLIVSLICSLSKFLGKKTICRTKLRIDDIMDNLDKKDYFLLLSCIDILVDGDKRCLELKVE